MPSEEKASNVQANNNSNAVGSISVGGGISSIVHLGNIGYSPKDFAKLQVQITSTFQAKL